MAKPKKWYKKKKKKARKFLIQIRTNTGWKQVELLKDAGRYLLVKLPCGEIIKRKYFNHIRWGKVKLVSKKV